MTAIISNRFRVRAATAMKEYLSNFDNNIYMYIGKGTTWDSLGDQQIDPVNSWKNITSSYSDMIIAKKVLSSNVTMCINRYDWEAGTVYSQYDISTPNFHDNNRFYVLTEDMNVYKCLNNNFNALSLVKPIGTSIDPFQLSDGYVWKYMYTLSNNDITYFLSSQFIPVTNDPLSGTPSWVNKNAAVDGSIDSYVITNTGTGYTTATATVSGDGTGAKVVPVINNGEIVRLVVSSKGSGYSRATVTITGNGTGATAIAQLSPRGGHGSNPVEELGGYYVMVMMDFGDVDDEHIPSQYSFRKIGIIENPYSNSNQPYTGYVAGGTYVLYTTSSGFKSGDIVEFSNGERTSLLDITTDGGKAIVSGVSEINPGDTFYAVRDASITGIVNSVTPPDFKPSSWNPLFIEHRNQVSTGLNQSQYTRFVVEF